MQKLSRFLILAALYLLLWLVSYCIIPCIVFVFGGSFLDVAQNVAFAVIFGAIILNVGLGLLFAECFNCEFYTKTKNNK
jgi:hypothetical protein